MPQPTEPCTHVTDQVTLTTDNHPYTLEELNELLGR